MSFEPTPQWKINRMRAMRKAGWLVKDIASALNLNVDTVSRYTSKKLLPNEQISALLQGWER